MSYTESGADSPGLSFYESTQAWQSWIEGRLAERLADERGYTSALLEEVLRGLTDQIERAVIESHCRRAAAGWRPGRA
jgi:hypothetical protein